jgi:hypothetical protein
VYSVVEATYLIEVYRRFRGAARGSLVRRLHNALMMEAENISETSVKFYQTILQNIPEDSHQQTSSVNIATYSMLQRIFWFCCSVQYVYHHTHKADVSDARCHGNAELHCGRDAGPARREGSPRQGARREFWQSTHSTRASAVAAPTYNLLVHKLNYFWSKLKVRNPHVLLQNIAYLQFLHSFEKPIKISVCMYI